MSAVFVLLNALAALIYLFIFWKRTKNDFTEEQIFGTSLLVLLLVISPVLISVYTPKDGWFWAAVLGSLIGLLISRKKFAINILECLEALFIAFLPWLSIICLYDFVVHGKILSLSLLAVVILTSTVFLVVDRNYKKIIWYKSGKIGIAGLISIIVFFTLRMLIGIAAPDMLSFLGNYDIILSTVVITASIIASARLATRKSK